MTMLQKVLTFYSNQCPT